MGSVISIQSSLQSSISAIASGDGEISDDSRSRSIRRNVPIMSATLSRGPANPKSSKSKSSAKVYVESSEEDNDSDLELLGQELEYHKLKEAAARAKTQAMEAKLSFRNSRSMRSDRSNASFKSASITGQLDLTEQLENISSLLDVDVPPTQGCDEMEGNLRSDTPEAEMSMSSPAVDQEDVGGNPRSQGRQKGFEHK